MFRILLLINTKQYLNWRNYADSIIGYDFSE